MKRGADGQAVDIVSEERGEGEMSAGRGSVFRRAWRRLLRLAVFLVLLPYLLILLYLIGVVHPVSTLMLRDLVFLRGYDRQWVEFEDIAPVLVQSVMMSEDGQFCTHAGVDWTQMRGVVEDALEGSRRAAPAPFRCRRSRTCFYGTGVPSSARRWNCRSRSSPTLSGASGG